MLIKGEAAACCLCEPGRWEAWEYDIKIVADGSI